MAEIVPTHLRKKRTNRKCSCGCGGLVYGRWPYLKGHNKAGGVVPALKRGRPAKAKESAVQAYRAMNDSAVSSHVTVELHVTPEWLDLAWSRLDPQQKAAAIATVLEA